ncbi:TrmB family transcriptional regulator [Thermococcus sp. LS2]|uniref:TrmB family transcriptional regulator n=1 Tax=Thermococcus sp. LS2 TaxID=1638260 RepID=UPI0014387254|nr:TrmB family transcriptional regulator [Thermococcus sp. LS2]NJE11853.1 TrmB family transcriptional regulator [Thermococcus sp. LS2]
MSEKELKELLKELGFNEYEVSAYLTLIKEGPLTAGELATLSKVPQPRIYDVIRTLMGKGLVITMGGRPKKVVAIDPDKVFSEIEQKYVRKVSLVKEMLKELYNPGESEVGSIIVVKSKITFEKYVKEAIKNAKRHISLALPSSFLMRIQDDLMRKKQMGVEIDLFVYGVGEVPPVAHKIKVREVSDPFILIQDKETGIYAPSEALMSKTSSLRGYAMIIKDENLLFMFDRYFYYALWPTGKTVYEEERNLVLPKEYIHIRKLVRDIRLFNLVNSKVKIIGKFVKSGEPVEIEGRIVDYYEDKAKVISNITVETEDGKRYIVGGWKSSLEDIEADLLILKEKGS